MPKFSNDIVLDQALAYIRSNATRQVACTQAPSTFAEANADYALADVTMIPGDFTISDGAPDGRQLEVAAKAGISVDTQGTATHLALLDVTNAALLYVTECTAQLLADGSSVDFGAWSVTLRDPV